MLSWIWLVAWKDECLIVLVKGGGMRTYLPSPPFSTYPPGGEGEERGVGCLCVQLNGQPAGR